MVSPVGLMISLLVKIQFAPAFRFTACAKSALFLRPHVRFLGRTDIERQPELMGSVENDPQRPSNSRSSLRPSGQNWRYSNEGRFLQLECCDVRHFQTGITGVKVAAGQDSASRHLDFANISYLARRKSSYPGPSGKDAVARRPTLRCRINVPLLVRVGISRDRAEIHTPSIRLILDLLQRAALLFNEEEQAGNWSENVP
jgi:hypothetical protein